MCKNLTSKHTVYVTLWYFGAIQGVYTNLKRHTVLKKEYILYGQHSSYGCLLFLINSPCQGWQCLRKRFLCRNQVHLHDKTLVQHHQRQSESPNRGRVCFHLLLSIRVSQPDQRGTDTGQQTQAALGCGRKLRNASGDDSGCSCVLTVTIFCGSWHSGVYWNLVLWKQTKEKKGSCIPHADMDR